MLIMEMEIDYNLNHHLYRQLGFKAYCSLFLKRVYIKKVIPCQKNHLYPL